MLHVYGWWLSARQVLPLAAVAKWQQWDTGPSCESLRAGVRGMEGRTRPARTILEIAILRTFSFGGSGTGYPGSYPVPVYIFVPVATVPVPGYPVPGYP